MRAVIDGQYKLILDATEGTVLLFDTGSDPGEHDNLAEQEPALVAARVEHLRAYEETALASESETTEVPEELLEKLKSLGCVD